MTPRNEADTRAELIDPKLKAAGWSVIEGSFIRREVICPGRILTGGKRGAQVASDYVLVDDYLSPQALWALTFKAQDKQLPDFKRIWRDRFSAIPFECKGDWAPRYYQENAINNALEAIAEGQQRILLTLATGTGKTCIAFQIAWKLFYSRWSLSAQTNPEEAKRRPRILFLADRNILANQAFNDFAPFGEDAIVRIEPSEIKKKGRVPKNASEFFTIFQTFMSGASTGSGTDAVSTPPVPEPVEGCFGDYP